MKKIILLILFAFGNVIFGQDAPSDGDIIFTQIGSVGNDVIEFITLKRLNLTTLKITDNGVLSNGKLRGGEGTIDLSATNWTDVAGGTFVRLSDALSNDNDDSDRILVYSASLSLVEGGDQVIAYKGTSDSPVFIAGIAFAASKAEWLTSGEADANTSYAPETLSDLYPGTRDNWYYSGTVNGDAATTRNSILNIANWTPSTTEAGYQDLTENIGNSSLPVELVSFTAASTSSATIVLKWQTATEVNNYGFDIQRSVLPKEFGAIGFVEGHGYSNSPKEYEFVDENPPSGNLEYRLKQIDTDGQFEYFNNTAKVDNQVTDVNDQFSDGIPSKFELSQNFPNPFNPTTMIKYELPENGNVELKIYDMLGKEIATVVNEVQNAGVHYERFNAANLASGVYIYALKFGNYYDAKKLTLIY